MFAYARYLKDSDTRFDLLVGVNSDLTEFGVDDDPIRDYHRISVDFAFGRLSSTTDNHYVRSLINWNYASSEYKGYITDNLAVLDYWKKPSED